RGGRASAGIEHPLGGDRGREVDRRRLARPPFGGPRHGGPDPHRSRRAHRLRHLRGALGGGGGPGGAAGAWGGGGRGGGGGAGVEGDGGDEVLVRREISRSGRNRVFVNDQPATLRLLAELSPHLLRIHGQREELGLVDPELQRVWLDKSGGAEGERRTAEVA